MFDAFSRHLAQSHLISAGQTVVVAYSGGADSTCLLHLLSRLNWNLSLIAAHLNHGQREEGHQEAEQCRAFAESLGAQFMVAIADVPRMATSEGIGIEEAGRLARYGFLEQVAMSLEAHVIATGHTLDDHAETILYNLSRGTGLRGMAGIPEHRDNIVRPLLPFTREETRGYCQEHGLWFHDDPYNFDPHYSRTIIRHEALPALEKAHAGAKLNIARLAGLVKEEDAFLDQMAARVLEDALEPINGALQWLTEQIELKLDAHKIAHAPLTLSRRALRLAAVYLGTAPELSHIEKVLSALESGQAGAVTLEGGKVRLEWDSKTITAEQTTVEKVSRYPVGVPGDTESPVFGWVIRADNTKGSTDDLFDVTFDASKVKPPFHLRSFEAGDKIDVPGMEGHKKIGDLFQEKRLSAHARARLPVVCDMGGPLWVPGVAISRRAIVDAGTNSFLRLIFERL